MNTIYDRARYELLTGQLNWLAADLLLTAWRGVPTFVATDTTVSIIKARGGVEAGSSLPINLTTVTPDGTAQTDPVVIPLVPIGADVTWFTLSERQAILDNSTLLLFIDEAIDLPFIPNGLDMLIQPDWALERGWWRP